MLIKIGFNTPHISNFIKNIKKIRNNATYNAK